MKSELKLNNLEVGFLSESELLEISGGSIIHSVGVFIGQMAGYIMNDATNPNYTQSSGSKAMHGALG